MVGRQIPFLIFRGLVNSPENCDGQLQKVPWIGDFRVLDLTFNPYVNEVDHQAGQLPVVTGADHLVVLVVHQDVVLCLLWSSKVCSTRIADGSSPFDSLPRIPLQLISLNYHIDRGGGGGVEKFEEIKILKFEV